MTPRKPKAKAPPQDEAPAEPPPFEPVDKTVGRWRIRSARHDFTRDGVPEREELVLVDVGRLHYRLPVDEAEAIAYALSDALSSLESYTDGAGE